jgi:hypothetical protein
MQQIIRNVRTSHGAVVFKLRMFRGTLEFLGRFQGFPQAHMLHNEIGKYNSDKFNFVFYFPRHICA